MPLKLQPNDGGLPDDHHVMQGEWQIGRIYKWHGALQSEAWLWWISTISPGPAGRRFSGTGGSLDEALTALNESWEKLLAWAQLTSAGTEPANVGHPRVDADQMFEVDTMKVKVSEEPSEASLAIDRSSEVPPADPMCEAENMNVNISQQPSEAALAIDQSSQAPPADSGFQIMNLLRFLELK
jgi:hypothetical protein